MTAVGTHSIITTIRATIPVVTITAVDATAAAVAEATVEVGAMAAAETKGRLHTNLGH